MLEAIGKAQRLNGEMLSQHERRRRNGPPQNLPSL
jgi:hypothetical protein